MMLKSNPYIGHIKNILIDELKEGDEFGQPWYQLKYLLKKNTKSNKNE